MAADAPMTSDVQAARENAVLVAVQLDAEEQPLHAGTIRTILSALTTAERERDEARALAADTRSAVRELRLADSMCARNQLGCDQRWDRALHTVCELERRASALTSGADNGG